MVHVAEDALPGGSEEPLVIRGAARALPPCVVSQRHDVCPKALVQRKLRIALRCEERMLSFGRVWLEPCIEEGSVLSFMLRFIGAASMAVPILFQVFW